MAERVRKLFPQPWMALLTLISCGVIYTVGYIAGKDGNWFAGLLIPSLFTFQMMASAAHKPAESETDS